MTTLKSYEEYLLGMTSAMVEDLADWFPEEAKGFERDKRRLRSAVEKHGFDFFFVTMPLFRKHLDKCLSEGRLVPSGLNNFGPTHRHGVIPRLFQGLTLRVFDSNGELKPDADHMAIRCLRQVLGFARKFRVSCGLDNDRKAVVEFFRIDNALPPEPAFWAGQVEAPSPLVSFRDYVQSGRLFNAESMSQLGERRLEHILTVIQQVADLMAGSIGDIDVSHWRFKHGPGAVADAKGSYKYKFPSWSARLEEVFPYADFGCHNHAAWVETLSAREVPQEVEVPVKLVAVPKTRTGPRLIAVEPTANQWCQQAIRDFLYTRVEGSFINQFIRFDEQEYNGNLALAASIYQTHATIDLSSASDRISCSHVSRLFRRLPQLLLALRATRARWVAQDICGRSPSLEVLRKYSTMGNATTFPVQSLFFLALALGCELYARNFEVSYESIRRVARSVQVRVFGDDIITSNASSGILVDVIHLLGLKVNTSKTFEHGKFKESCGVDAFGGSLVTSVNVMMAPSRSEPESVVSTVDVHNNLIDFGWFRAATYVRKTAEASGITKVATRKHGSGLFGWTWNPLDPRSNLDYLKVRWNKEIQRQEILADTVTAQRTRSTSVGHYGLLQYFTERSPFEVEFFRHAEVSSVGWDTRRPTLKLRRRWVLS